MSLGPFRDLAATAIERARAAGSELYVNDRPDVAALAGATGVHLGQSDLTPADARLVLSSSQRVGVSTHSLSQARQALQDGADYVAIGPVFPTFTKANPDPTVGLAGVREASALVRGAGRPLVAIGGISLETALGVIEAGADSVAVISDLLVADWRGRATRWLRALD